MLITSTNNVYKYHIAAVELTLIYNVRYSRAVNLATIINAAMDEFEISKTSARRNMFLAQISHESRFKSKAENLNYKAEQLVKTWPKRFRTIEHAKLFAQNPEKIANYVYGNRMENKGEGFRFRGRGGIQITGRENYLRLSKDLRLGTKLTDNPDLLLGDSLAWRASAWFWKKHRLNEVVDTDPSPMEKVTKKINGGLTGMDDRIRQHQRIINYLPDNGGDLLRDFISTGSFRVS